MTLGYRTLGAGFRAAEGTLRLGSFSDGDGLPLRLALSPGEAHDNRLAGKLLSRLKSGSMLLAICFSPYLYRARNRVERFFNRIKQCRRVATRYDKLAANYLAFVQLASIRLWLTARYESTPKS
ncbi:transposase [Bradyrhizobium elkanii]